MTAALHKLSIAPMMDRTDRHFRWFMRQITRRTLLYTEMVTTGAVLHGDREKLLGYDPEEHPVALQLGGDDPTALATCARIAEDLGYDEVNLNVGCPSDRVVQGSFGAVLMRRPEHVADCVAAMKAVVRVPVTVKHRIGVDEIDSYEHMLRFVDVVAAAGADRFSVHARKAWLQGLSPKENREIPPLRHPEVHRLKQERPHLLVETNGGILTLNAAIEHLQHVDAVMIGRAAVDDPWLFADADQRVYGSDQPAPTREAAVDALLDYAGRLLARGGRLHHATRHAVHLYRGLKGAGAWRRVLTEASRNDDLDELRRALEPLIDRRRVSNRRRIRAATPIGPPHPGPFGEALAAVEASSFVWDPDDVLAEAHGNEMWFSHRPPDATAEQVVEFLLEVARLRGVHRSAVGAPSGAVVFYVWHDEQAGHLRASSVSASQGSLPFKRPVPAEAIAIAHSWVTEPGGLIPWGELEDVDAADSTFEAPELPVWATAI